MAAPSLKEQLASAVKDAMRSKDKDRLTTLRMAQAAVKQIEIDERRDLGDDDVLKVLDKMLKQRRDAASQYDDAGRPELAGASWRAVGVSLVFHPRNPFLPTTHANLSLIHI